MPDRWLETVRLPDDPEALRGGVTESEWNESAAMKPVSRRIEWLAWRAIVRKKLGGNIRISYDGHDAPVLDEGKGFIGVSHTKGAAAVVWSPEPCAVDIEPLSRDVSRTSAKFISETECALAGASDPRFPISVWCAKEALYKYSRTPGLDFLDDIHIVSAAIAAGRMAGSVKNGDPIAIDILFHNGFVIATIF